MRLSILTIYLKDMKEILRDRKTLIFMLLLPTLVVPVLMNVMIGFISRAEKKARTETLNFAIFGAEFLPELADAFTEEKGFEKVNISAPEAIESAISENQIKFGLVIPQEVRKQFESGEQVAVQLYYNNASVASRVKDRAGKVIQEVSKRWRSDRLAALGLDTAEKRENLLSPITIEEHGTANMREVLGERLGGMLPYLFIIFCFMGAMYPAIDIGAGEKERGTLETLLLAPIRRNRVVLGKFLVIFTTGLTAALLSLTSIGLMLAVKGQEVTGPLGEVIESISVLDLVLIGAMLIPTAAIFASLLLSISVYAKSFKEASSYCGPLNFLVIIPALVGLLPWVELDWIRAMVPITNISLAIKELVKGTMNYQMLVAILGSSFIIAGALLVFCTKWFEREAVLFRE
ncbi:MAG: ABC transporter permease [Planctomycetota bacterium]